MMTLPEFLFARYDEEQAIAKAAATRDYGEARPPRYRTEPHWAAYEDFDEGGLTLAAFAHGNAAQNFLDSQVRELLREETDETRHIMWHDPATVLADLDAKRRIIDACMMDYEVNSATDDPAHLALEVLIRLAQPYTDHADFDPAWRLGT